MLRQYYQTTARSDSGLVGARGGIIGGTGGNGASGTGVMDWTLKDSRDVIPSSGSGRGQLRPMSSRILAVGVVLVGVLVLSVALIMGLEFPKHVFSEFRDDQCVVHKNHDKVASWLDGSQWKREVRLYYQHLLNPDQFLYHGAHPSFQERGPYVYEEYETREDVTFSVTEVTYRLSRRHVYSDTMTAKECSACRQDDSLTVVNTDYLRAMYESGGHSQYLLSVLPATLSTLLEQEGFSTDLGSSSSSSSPFLFFSNISFLGCLDPVCEHHHHNNSNSSTSPNSTAARLSFGRWLRTATTSSSQPQASVVVVNSRANTSFSASETGAVYRALLNATVLRTDVYKSRTDLQAKCLSWAKDLCQGQGRQQQQQQQQPEAELSGLDLDEVCGLVHILQSCDARSSSLQPEVKEVFVSSFCESPGSSVWCLDLRSVAPGVLSAYFQVFQDYILLYLLQVIHDHVLSQTNRDLVVTRPQSELALGYYVSTPADQSAKHVQGLLSDYWLKSPWSKGALLKVNTCLKDRDLNNNMKVREFGGSQYAPQGLLRGESYSVHFSGHTDFFPACKPVSCCACASPGQSVHLFLPPLQRALRYTDPEAVSLWDKEVYRYWLSQDSFSWNSRYDVNCGLQQMTSSLGFMGWLGLPRLSSEYLEMAGSDLGNCSLPAPKSFMDIEPVTGRVWQRVTQLQLNAGIRPEDVTGPRWRPLNVTYLLKATPVVWSQRKMTLSDGELGYYDYKVQRLLRTSCGGLIGLSVLAVLVAGVGVVIFFYPKRANRVAPALESDLSTGSHLHHHSRFHHNNSAA